jgi:hypothetical protein
MRRTCINVSASGYHGVPEITASKDALVHMNDSARANQPAGTA